MAEGGIDCQNGSGTMSEKKVTYVGHADVYRCHGASGAVYEFHRGEPLDVPEEDVASVTGLTRPNDWQEGESEPEEAPAPQAEDWRVAEPRARRGRRSASRTEADAGGPKDEVAANEE